MPESGGTSYYNMYDYANQIASGYGQHASIYNNGPMQAILESVCNTLFGKSFRELPGSVQNMVQTFAPQFMQLIPGVGDSGMLYQNMYQAGVTSGQFSGTGAVEAAQQAHALAMLVQNTLYDDRGYMNMQVTRGLSGRLSEDVAVAMVGDYLNRHKLRTERVNLSAPDQQDTSAPASNVQAEKRAMARINKLYNDRQITAQEKAYYENSLQTVSSHVRAEAAVQNLFENSPGEVITTDSGQVISNAEEFTQLRKANKAQAEKIINKAMQVYNSDRLTDAQRDKLEQGVMKDLRTGKGSKYTDVQFDNQSTLNTIQSVWDTNAILTVFNKDDAEGINKMLQESLPAINESVSVLSKAFNTQDFEELKQTARQLNLGSIASKQDVEKIKSNLNNAFAMSAATNRTIESVLTERKSIVEALSVLEGGKGFVSNDQVINIQRIRNQAIQNEAVGAFRTQDQEVEAYQRSYDNAKNVYGDIAALRGIMDKNKDLIPEADAKKVNEMWTNFQQALASGDTDLAEYWNKQAMQYLDRADINKEQRAWYGKDRVAEITNESAKAGAIGQFEEHLRISENLNFSDKQVQSLATAYAQGIDIVGTDAQAWGIILDIVNNEKYDTKDKKTKAITDNLGLGKGFEGQIGNLVEGLQVADKQGAAQIRAWVLEGGGGQAVIGQQQLIKENDAWVKHQIQSGAVNYSFDRDSNPIGTFFTSLLSTDEVITPQAYFKARVLQKMDESGGQLNFQQAVDALRADEQTKDTFEDVHYIGKLDEDNKLDEESISRLAERLGVDSDTFKTKYQFENGAIKWQDIVNDLGSDKPLSIADNMVYVGGKELAAAAQREVQDMQLLGRFNLTEALAGDNLIDQSELDKMIGQDQYISTTRTRNGQEQEVMTYNGPIQALKGMTKEEILNFFNKEDASSGKTMATILQERQYKDSGTTGEVMRVITSIEGYARTICGAVTNNPVPATHT